MGCCFNKADEVAEAVVDSKSSFNDISIESRCNSTSCHYTVNTFPSSKAPSLESAFLCSSPVFSATKDSTPVGKHWLFDSHQDECFA